MFVAKTWHNFETRKPGDFKALRALFEMLFGTFVAKNPDLLKIQMMK